MRFVKSWKDTTNKSLWEHDKRYYVCSSTHTFICSETMVFQGNERGDIVDLAGLYATEYTLDHDKVMKEFVND